MWQESWEGGDLETMAEGDLEMAGYPNGQVGLLEDEDQQVGIRIWTVIRAGVGVRVRVG